MLFFGKENIFSIITYIQVIRPLESFTYVKLLECEINILRLHMEFGSVVTDLAGSFVPIFGC